MDTFRCTHCGFAAAVQLPVPSERQDLALFPCPQCNRRGSRVGFALRMLGSCMLRITFVAMLFAIFATIRVPMWQPLPAFLLTGAIVGLSLWALFVQQWRKAHRESATKVELRCFWEWQLPAGPRVLAAQDPGSGEDVVWVDRIRAAAVEGDGYLVLLKPAIAGDPYRAVPTHAKLVFPADRTCWLTVGGKRIEPVRTSSDVA